MRVRLKDVAQEALDPKSPNHGTMEDAGKTPGALDAGGPGISRAPFVGADHERIGCWRFVI